MDPRPHTSLRARYSCGERLLNSGRDRRSSSREVLEYEILADSSSRASDGCLGEWVVLANGGETTLYRSFPVPVFYEPPSHCSWKWLLITNGLRAPTGEVAGM